MPDIALVSPQGEHKTLRDVRGRAAAIAYFLRDIEPKPRSSAEMFLNVGDYVEHRAGGRFAAWEQPESYVGSLGRAVKLGGW